MPNLSIKNVPVEVVEQLRARAAANHRSLQGELMALVCGAAEQGSPATLPVPSRSGWMTVDEIYAGNRDKRGQALVEGPLAVDIIRAERDAR